MQFPDNFFQDECRCGFMVSEMMKRAWAAELEVLEIVTDICKKYHLQYFADGGTLLGAVRHQGFIPWDDDIDIALRREDYNRLIRVLPRELPNGFVIAGMYADSERLQKAAEVQQLRVIADENYWSFSEYLKRFHWFPYLRIGIDIFVLDYIPRDTSLADTQKYLVHFTMDLLCNWDYYVQHNQLETQLTSIENLCNIKLKRDDQLKHKLWLLVDSLCSLYHGDESDDIAMYPFWITDDSFRLSKDCYAESIEVPFEHTQIAIPKKFHEVLTGEFGDYMVPIQGAAEHEYPFYKNQERELQEIFRREGIHESVAAFCRKFTNLINY